MDIFDNEVNKSGGEEERSRGGRSQKEQGHILYHFGKV